MTGSVWERETHTDISEAELVRRIRLMCEDLGLHAYHIYSYKIPGVSARPGSAAGFPDWVICGPGGLIFRECKSQDGRSSLRQISWGKALTAAGADYAVWRPSDLVSGLIASELQELALAD